MRVNELKRLHSCSNTSTNCLWAHNIELCAQPVLWKRQKANNCSNSLNCIVRYENCQNEGTNSCSETKFIAIPQDSHFRQHQAYAVNLLVKIIMLHYACMVQVMVIIAGAIKSAQPSQSVFQYKCIFCNKIMKSAMEKRKIRQIV